MQVKLNGFSGNAYDTITMNYFDTPYIEIKYPDELSHDTNVQIITISGTTLNTDIGDSVILYVNGYATEHSISGLSSVDGTWSGTVMLSGLGDSVTVKLSDQFGRTAYDTILVNYFEPPQIEITYPDYVTHDTNVQIITIRGTTLNSRNGDTAEIS